MTATEAPATQAELDATTYDAYVRNGENKAAAGRELGINPSTVADRVKRHLARREQDTLADSLALDAAQAAQDAEYAADSEAAEQTEAERLAAKYGAMDGGAKAEAQRLSSKYGDLPDPVHGGDVFSRIEASNPDMRAIAETAAAFTGKPVTEDPDESLVALLEQDAPAEDDDTDELAARPGPGQAEDNIVHQMACGHEYDSPVELAPGQSVQCSAHGQTEIAGDQEPEAALAAKAGYEGAVCPECDAIAYAYKGGHFTDCRYHKLNAAAAGHVGEAFLTAVTVNDTVIAMTRRVDITGQDDEAEAPAAEVAPEPDTADDPQAQAERDALMDQSCRGCGVEVDYDGAEIEHLDNCPDAPGIDPEIAGILAAGAAGGVAAAAAQLGEMLASAPESPAPAPQPVPAKAGRFPEGVVTPNEFRGALVAEGIVPEKSVHYLGYKLANENPGSFPARWYAKDGTSYDYDNKQPGSRLGIHLAGGREWVKNRPAKPARQSRTPKVKAVLFEDGKPAERLVALLGGADLAAADVAALYAAYAAQRGQAGTLQGFTGWLVAEGADWLSEAAPRLAEAG